MRIHLSKYFALIWIVADWSSKIVATTRPESALNCSTVAWTVGQPHRRFHNPPRHSQTLRFKKSSYKREIIRILRDYFVRKFLWRRLLCDLEKLSVKLPYQKMLIV